MGFLNSNVHAPQLVCMSNILLNFELQLIVSKLDSNHLILKMGENLQAVYRASDWVIMTIQRIGNLNGC